MLRFLHDQDLVNNELLARLGSQVHLLDGDLFAGGQSLRDEDVARSAASKQVSRMLAWINGR